MKSIVLLAFIVFFSNDCRSQEYNYFHYDVKAGLGGITIYTIAQDKDGFLWFGTETGLSRFDGTNFTNYKANEGLNDNEIIYLFVDSKNRVWIFPFKNSVYYYLNGKIFNTSNDPLLKNFHLKNEIFKAAEDKDGNIFFLETDRLHILTKNNKLTEVDKIAGKAFFNNGCGISASGDCNFFMSSPNDISNHRINSYEYKNSEFKFLNAIQDYNFTRNTIEINAHYKLFRNRNYFEIFDQKTQVQFNIKVPDHFHTLSYIDDSSLTVSTSEKTFLFNVKQKRITDSFLTNTIVNKCYKDKEGNLWFATMSEGVYRLSSTNFKVFTLQNGSGKVSVHALEKSGNGLYIGAEKSLLWDLNIANNTVKQISIVTDYDINRTSAIQLSNNNDLFLGTDNGVFKKEGNSTQNYFPRTVIKSLFLHNDSLIFASDRNVFDVPLKNIKFTDTIWRTRATCACKLNNEYYVGTLGGLYSIESSKKHSSVALGKTYPEFNDKIIALVPLLNGELWIATENFGLFCLQNNKIKYHITKDNGLTSNVCRCVFIDDKTVWLGTDKGVSKINTSHIPFRITQFTSAEGLDCEIINCIYAHNDSVFVGTPFGLTFFNAAKNQRQSICKLKLLDIQSKNGDWFNQQSHIRLKANDNFLLFQYAGISFVSSADVTYYYQLRGLDNTWRSTKQNSVEFDLLPAGSYVLKIYATNKYGVKSNIIIVAFTKAKEFWQLLWVRGLSLITFCLIVWFIATRRIKHIRKDANKKILFERKLSELEQMALRAQMNPHFIFNSLNSIQQYVFSGNVLEANQFITNFSSLIRQTLYISGKKFINLEDEIQYLESYLAFEQCKYDNIFDFKINKDEKIILENIVVPPLLLQPFIENSIRHGLLNLNGRRGIINIYFKMQDNLITCIIKDNGIGREESFKLKNKTVLGYQSKGMELVQKRIENLNLIYNTFIIVSIEDIKGDETGTSVIIKLPLYYDE